MRRAHIHSSGVKTVIAVFCLPGAVKRWDRNETQPLTADTRLERWGGDEEPILLVYDPSRIYAAYTLTFSSSPLPETTHMAQRLLAMRA